MRDRLDLAPGFTFSFGTNLNVRMFNVFTSTHNKVQLSHTLRHRRKGQINLGDFSVLLEKVCSCPKTRFFKTFYNVTSLGNKKTQLMQFSPNYTGK